MVIIGYHGNSTPLPLEVCSMARGQLGNNTFISRYNEYDGIPENLIINVIVWLLLLLVFSFLRKMAWNYGRIALVMRKEEKWTSLFYGEQEDKLHESMESVDTQLHVQDRGLCSWILAFIRVKDSDIMKKCGHDAIQYITFQRYLLLYVTIVTVLSSAVIIPVNFTGSNIGNATDFGHTTLANLDVRSPLLWVHASMCIIYLLLAIGFMYKFSVNLTFVDDEQVSKTLMVANIPVDRCYKSTIMQHFHEGYPEVHVEDVQFAYNVTDLMDLENRRAAAAEARLVSDFECSKTGVRPTIRPYPCGQCLCCGDSCGCLAVDAISYYGDVEERLTRECEKEKATAYNKCLGVAFVTFENVAMAERILLDFQPSYKASQNPQPSSIHLELDVVDWNVTYAPAPEDIYWGNLSLSGYKWWIKAIVLNTLLIVLLFFLTTPTIVLNNLDKFNYQDFVKKTHSALLIEFLPTLLLWTFTALLPNLIYYADKYVGYWTRASEHHAVMQKTFILLLLMVLILPSLGLTSASALFDFFILEQNREVRWRCIFLADNGAFFVNYVITSAFIGIALELLRFSELFVFGIKMLRAKSSAERKSVQKQVLWEFPYGIQYAWFLCVFAVIMSYSISCPLITPFGLLYMAFKHVVDRYNLYFAYKPSCISQDIHWSAISYVILSVIFVQFNFAFFSVIRGELQQPIAIFSLVILLIALVIFFGRVCFGCFKSVMPFKKSKYRQFSEQNEDTNECQNQSFVPGVLIDSTPSGAVCGKDLLVQSDDIQEQRHSYGAMDSRLPCANLESVDSNIK